MNILSKFGSNWATGSRQEDFYVKEFPIGSYVKLSSAVGAILVDRSWHTEHVCSLNFNIYLL